MASINCLAFIDGITFLNLCVRLPTLLRSQPSSHNPTDTMVSVANIDAFNEAVLQARDIDDGNGPEDDDGWPLPRDPIPDTRGQLVDWWEYTLIDSNYYTGYETREEPVDPRENYDRYLEQCRAQNIEPLPPLPRFADRPLVAVYRRTTRGRFIAVPARPNPFHSPGARDDINFSEDYDDAN
ncbi:hypothetical protein EIP91_010700, partial [Steccherinum ochraceum]